MTSTINHSLLPPVVEIDPLFDEGPESMIELAHRFGAYRVYGTWEEVDHPLGRGLMPRHDSIMNYVRHGGLHDTERDPAALAARTSYFREEYAYGADENVAGIGSFLHSDRLADAARQVHQRPVVVPAIAFANLMVPGQELAVHTDVPEFRGVNRRSTPQWLLVVMHHSGLFDRWRLPIATGVAWFHDSDAGAFVHWPDGPGGAKVDHSIRSNTAAVLDTDTIFHGVDRVGAAAQTAPDVTPGSTLVPAEHVGGDWSLRDAGGLEVARVPWSELRYSVSWKAYCFDDESERNAWQDHTDDLDLDTVVDRLVDDLAERGLVSPGVERDSKLGLLLIDTYVRFPTESTAGGSGRGTS